MYQSSVTRFLRFFIYKIDRFFISFKSLFYNVHALSPWARRCQAISILIDDWNNQTNMMCSCFRMNDTHLGYAHARESLEREVSNVGVEKWINIYTISKVGDRNDIKETKEDGGVAIVGRQLLGQVERMRRRPGESVGNRICCTRRDVNHGHKLNGPTREKPERSEKENARKRGRNGRFGFFFPCHSILSHYLFISSSLWAID